MNEQRLDFRFAPPTALGRFSGIANHFPTTDAHGTRFAPGSFARSLDHHKTRSTWPPMFWSHDRREPIGKWVRIEDANDRLSVEGQLILEVGRAREALALMQNGLVGLSVGFTPREQRRAADGVVEFTRVDLDEISLVALPSNHKSTITEVRHMPSVRDLEHTLRDAGLSSAQAKRLLSGGYSALRRDGADDDAEALAAGLRDLLSQIKG